MSRIGAKMAALRNAKRKALIPFITAGDPSPEFTLEAMRTLVRSGADILEIGVPFSDPMADGPVIQRASERALAHGMSLRRTLQLVKTFRQEDAQTPIVLMGYLNPIEALGYERFCELAGDASVDGVLTVDMPPEESGLFLTQLEAFGIDPIFLLAPNSVPARIRKMGELGRGYLYYVALKGVTGAGHLDLADVERKLSEIRALATLPVAVGFGVKDEKTASAVARAADGVVVGSALVSLIEASHDQPDEALKAMEGLMSAIRKALDQVPSMSC